MAECPGLVVTEVMQYQGTWPGGRGPPPPDCTGQPPGLGGSNGRWGGGGRRAGCATARGPGATLGQPEETGGSVEVKTATIIGVHLNLGPVHGREYSGQEMAMLRA